MTTLVVSPEDWERQNLDLTADSFHHLFRVKRLRSGDRIRLVDGAGRAREAIVEGVERDSARLSLGHSIASHEAALQVEVIVAMPRPQRAAWLVEKATEIGVRAVRFVNTGRSPRSYGSSTVGRLERIARGAVEQCERSLVPEISAGHSWAEVPRLVSRLEACWLLDLAAPVVELRAPRSAARIGIVVGPEGGWEEAERNELSELGCVPAGLGARVLRIETAAVVAASLLLVTSSVDTL